MIQNTIIALVSCVLFALLAIGASNKALIGLEAFSVPFVSVKTSFSTLLFVLPMILLGLSAYLHDFLLALGGLDAGDRKADPTGVTMPAGGDLRFMDLQESGLENALLRQVDLRAVNRSRASLVGTTLSEDAETGTWVVRLERFGGGHRRALGGK